MTGDHQVKTGLPLTSLQYNDSQASKGNLESSCSGSEFHGKEKRINLTKLFSLSKPVTNLSQQSVALLTKKKSPASVVMSSMKKVAVPPGAEVSKHQATLSGVHAWSKHPSKLPFPSPVEHTATIDETPEAPKLVSTISEKPQPRTGIKPSRIVNKIPKEAKKTGTLEGKAAVKEGRLTYPSQTAKDLTFNHSPLVDQILREAHVQHKIPPASGKLKSAPATREVRTSNLNLKQTAEQLVRQAGRK